MPTCERIKASNLLFAMSVAFNFPTSPIGSDMSSSIPEIAITLVRTATKSFQGAITWQIIWRFTPASSLIHVPFVARRLPPDPTTILISELTLPGSPSIRKSNKSQIPSFGNFYFFAKIGKLALTCTTTDLGKWEMICKILGEFYK